jgi:hypothetical protein
VTGVCRLLGGFDNACDVGAVHFTMSFKLVC